MTIFKIKILKSSLQIPCKQVLITSKLCNFCENIKIVNYGFNDKIKDINKLEEYFEFYQSFKIEIENQLDKKLLFLDHLSTCYKNNFLEVQQKEKVEMYDILNSSLQNITADRLKNIDEIYILSLLESLYNLNYYPDIEYVSGNNKLWIILEYFILRTNFLKDTSIDNYNIILKSFQKFYLINNVTISAEEIFEAIEYEIILKLKDPKFVYEKENVIKILDIFILFAKNLEGSRELYTIFIEKIIYKLNFSSIRTINPSVIVSLYFSLINIIIFIDPKSKIIKNLILEIEKHAIELKNLSESSENILKWCISQRNKNKL